MLSIAIETDTQREHHDNAHVHCNNCMGRECNQFLILLPTVVHIEYYAEIRKANDDESRRRGIPWVGPGGQSRMMMMIIFWCYRTN